MEELKLTVYFEDPFWVGVFERTQNGTLSVCKITFGAEPKDYAVHAYVLRHFYELRFSPALSARQHVQCSNPKRRQRQVQKQLSGAGVGNWIRAPDKYWARNKTGGYCSLCVSNSMRR